MKRDRGTAEKLRLICEGSVTDRPPYDNFEIKTAVYQICDPEIHNAFIDATCGEDYFEVERKTKDVHQLVEKELNLGPVSSGDGWSRTISRHNAIADIITIVTITKRFKHPEEPAEEN
jgi:hypothetical protein